MGVRAGEGRGRGVAPVPRGGRVALVVALGALVAISPGCSSPEAKPTRKPLPPEPRVAALRVGVTSDAPPFCFRQGDRLAGIELDLAHLLARELRRGVEVVDIPRDELIDALLGGEIDMIMAGMTITRLRQLRVAFGKPYLQSGLAVLVRRSESERTRSPAAALRAAERIGVAKGTTGEKYVRDGYHGAQIFTYTSNASGVADLEQRRTDAFVGDAPTVAWYAAENEGSLLALLRPLLSKEQIGWGFRPGDDLLQSAADEALVRWKRDGTLTGVLRRWLPRWVEEDGVGPRAALGPAAGPRPDLAAALSLATRGAPGSGSARPAAPPGAPEGLPGTAGR